MSEAKQTSEDQVAKTRVEELEKVAQAKAEAEESLKNQAVKDKVVKEQVEQIEKATQTAVQEALKNEAAKDKVLKDEAQQTGKVVKIEVRDRMQEKETSKKNQETKQKEVLLEVNHLTKEFVVEKNFFGKPTKVLKAVEDVSFKIYKQEAFGLVGESGCGKTTIGKMLANVYTPTSGQILYNGVDLAKLKEKERRAYCKEIQLVFQDPYASLNPRMTIGDIIAEPIRINKLMPKEDIEKRVLYLLSCVGLASHQRNRYPHEFSGGQRQRVGIARALAASPKLIICDEPVSALDVSIQAQVLNLLADLKEEFGLTYLFIAHGLNVVKHISDRVGVMYLGKMQELADKHELYNTPMHPYTKALLSSTPVIDPKLKHSKERIILKGDVPSPISPPSGCRFHTRCYLEKAAACTKECPSLVDATGNNHFVACHLK